jgi:endoglucanase
VNKLGIDGNRIIDTVTGDPVLLRGVNRSGLEYSQTPLDPEEIRVIAETWGANIIRLPFNQDWALTSEPYLKMIDDAIAAAAAHGAYTLLDLQWLDTVTKQAPTPNAQSIELWQKLAGIYNNNPAVLYDIFSEPHDVTMTEWGPWAIQLTNAVRNQAPDALIFVSGIDWAYDLSGFPIEGLENLVYSTHIYKNKGDNWDKAFGDLSETHPVFAGEWGCMDATELDWGQQLLAYLNGRQIGWAAWSWSDIPHIIDPPAAPPYNPTPYGQLVGDALKP